MPQDMQIQKLTDLFSSVNTSALTILSITLILFSSEKLREIFSKTMRNISLAGLSLFTLLSLVPYEQAGKNAFLRKPINYAHMTSTRDLMMGSEDSIASHIPDLIAYGGYILLIIMLYKKKIEAAPILEAPTPPPQTADE